MDKVYTFIEVHQLLIKEQSVKSCFQCRCRTRNEMSHFSQLSYL